MTRREQCTCDLEPDFGVEATANAGVATADAGVFHVVDAECIRIATCRDRKHAELIAEALNGWAQEGEPYTCCLVHRQVPWPYRTDPERAG